MMSSGRSRTLSRTAREWLYSDRGVVAVARAHRLLRGHDLGRALVVSHMRSGSTLLVHLLNTNQAVFGFGESHVVYGGSAAHDRLLVKCLVHSRRPLLREHLLVDKVLHDHLVPDASDLAATGPLIFLVRRPETAILSLANAPSLAGWSASLGTRTIDGTAPDAALEAAAGYYIDRLGQLRALAEACRDTNACTLVRYEDLVHRPEATLERLARFLGVPGSFSSTYAMMPTTGRPGMGDPSSHIRKGYVDASRDEPQGQVPERLLAAARAAHRRTVTALGQIAHDVPDPAQATHPV